MHAPVAVSGRFGPREGLQPAAAVVDLAKDDLMQLCCPDDFALEAWVNPDDLTPAEVSKGDVKESRVISLKGELDTARYTMGLRSAMSLKLGQSESITVGRSKWASSDLPSLSDKESFSISTRFKTPEDPTQVGSLFQLHALGGTHTMFYVEVDYNGVWFKVMSLFSPLQFGVAKGVYAPFSGSPGDSVHLTVVWDIVTANVGQEGSDFYMQKDVDGLMRIYLDGQPISAARVKAIKTDGSPIPNPKLNFNAPVISASDKEIIKSWDQKINNIKPEERGAQVAAGDNFYEGCGLAIQEFRFYGKTLDQSDLISLPDTSLHRYIRKYGQSHSDKSIPLHWDFSKLQTGSGYNPNKKTFKVENQGDLGTQWDLTIEESDFEAGYQLYAATGARQALSNVQIPTQKWSHIAAVCSGNHALSFDPHLHQRAIVKDGNGLNARESFTIDCTVRWNGGGNKWSGSRGKQYIFSRSSADGSDMIFQLGLDGGKPFVEFGMTNANGEKERPLQYAGFRLKKNKSYYLVARCELSTETIEFYNDEGETTASFELWLLDKDIWAYDLDDEEWVNGLIPEIVELTEAQKEATIGFTNLFNLLPLMMDRMYHISEKNRFNTKIGLLQSDLMASIGSLSAEGDSADIREQGWFDGAIGQLRFWTRALSESELKRLALHAGVPRGVTPPTANWRFEENRGLLAYDAAGGMTATLSDENMWLTSRMTSRLSLYRQWTAGHLPLRGGWQQC